MSRFYKTLLFIGYLLVIAGLSLGQPARSSFSSLLSGFILYAFFWWILSQIKSSKTRRLFSFLGGLCIEGVKLSWLASPHYQGIGIYIVFLFFSIITAIQFYFFSKSIIQSVILTYSKALFFAGIWTLVEWSRLFFFCGYPFNPVGLSLAAFPLTMQLASIGGIYFLSFIVIWMNLLAYKGFLEKNRTPWIVYGVHAFTICLYGLAQMTRTSKEDEKMPVALVQTGWTLEHKGFFSDEKIKTLTATEQLYQLLLFAKQAMQNQVKLLVFPEATLPFHAEDCVYSKQHVEILFSSVFKNKNKNVDQHMAALQKHISAADIMQLLSLQLEADIVIGLMRHDFSSGGNFYNAAFCFSPRESYNWYGKRKLVPLGEYLPWGFSKKLAQTYGVTSFFSPGKEKIVFGSFAKYMPTICFEECFSDLVRKKGSDKVNFFVNITNDIWFYPSLLPAQHLHHAKLRAVENGVFHLRACNNGITAVIDPFGNIVKALPEKNKEGSIYQGLLLENIPFVSYCTFYSMWGDKAVVLLSFVSIGFWFLIRNKESSWVLSKSET